MDRDTSPLDDDFNIFRQLLDEFISPETFDTPEEYRLYAANFLNSIETNYYQYLESLGANNGYSSDSDNSNDDAHNGNEDEHNSNEDADNGNEDAPNDNNTENNVNNEENNVELVSSNERTFYDISLPIEHSYLGSMDSIQSKRPLFAPGSIVPLKTLYLDGIFLFPGQKIPLSFLHQVNIVFIKKILASESKIFGLRIGSVKDYFGTTAEILSFQEKDEIVTIKVLGRQRFRIIQDYTNSDSEYMPTIQILSDIGINNFYLPLTQCEPRLGNFTANLTWLPKIAADQYNNSILIKKLKDILMDIFEARVKKSNEFKFPIDATAFSYFVLMAIPFSDNIKTNLLKINCTNLRLRLLYSLLSENFKFICSTCCLKLCNRDSLFIMSKLGTGGTFVNSYGITHELYTFSNIQNVRRASHYSDEFSWFPNYGWIIIHCQRCLQHLGWEFVTKKDEIYPKTFFALTKSSIRLAFQLDGDFEDTFLFKLFKRDFILNNNVALGNQDPNVLIPQFWQGAFI